MISFTRVVYKQCGYHYKYEVYLQYIYLNELGYKLTVKNEIKVKKKCIK